MDFALDLESIKDDEVYDSKLFSIANSFDNSKRVLTISENLEKPLIIVNKLKNSETLYTNNLLINVKEGVKASVIEVFTSNLNNSTILANRTIEVEKNSSLEYVKIQDMSLSNSLIFSCKAKQDDKSNLEISNFEFGDGFCVNSFENKIDSPFFAIVIILNVNNIFPAFPLIHSNKRNFIIPKHQCCRCRIMHRITFFGIFKKIR